MKRIKLADRVLPNYTRSEEIFNMASHISGGGLAIAATAACLSMAIWHRNWLGLLSGVIYGACMIATYVFSSVYHGLRPGIGKKVLQILDHCAIYFMIAGTYTPFCLCVLRTQSPALGWIIFGLIWALAAIGVTLNAIDLQRYRVVSMILYLVMGWMIIFTAPRLVRQMGGTAFVLLLSGGIAYSVGAILYGLGRKKRWMHSVFHLFVILGSMLHFVCILLFMM